MKNSFIRSGNRDKRVATRLLTRTALFLALVLVVQMFRMPPFITGPLVNFMLIIAVIAAGIAGGVVIGFFTPWIALLVGILPAPLAPVVPFIMIGNALYCLLFGIGYKYSHTNTPVTGSRIKTPVIGGIGLAAGSLVKFIVIAGAARFLLNLPYPLAEALLLPQLLNAVVGGVAALLAGQYLKKIGVV